jgi:phosphoglycerol geranylgeranyltransferase
MTTRDELARRLGRLGRAVSVGARTVLPLDTNPVPAEWTHVTKVDPEREKKLPLLYPCYLQHTSAVSVGGSADVTAANTEAAFDLLAPASVPVFHEPSGPRHVTRRTREQADLLAIPEVLNGDSESLVGQLGAGTEYIREELVPEMVADKLPFAPEAVADAVADFATSWLLAEAVFEAYVIQNPDSAAAREANVSEGDLLSAREAKQRAMAAERHLGSELVYLEYSGTYGGQEAAKTLSAIADGLTWSRLWYGGGLDSREHAEAMLAAGADATVVGDAFHRVADEEADVVAAAVGELDAGTPASDVRAWVRDHLDVGTSAAASYLATIPSVAEPERLATRYLAATVRASLGVRAVADDLSANASTAADVRYLLADREAPWLGDAANLAPADGALVRRSVHSLLADAAGVPSPEDVEPAQFSVSASTGSPGS